MDQLLDSRQTAIGKNPFGADISIRRPQYQAHPHIVFIKHRSPRQTRHKTCLQVATVAVQVLMVESGYQFIIAVLSDSEAERLKRLPAVKGVGAVNIDVERLVSIMKNGI
jgi:hypothetical protein